MGLYAITYFLILYVSKVSKGQSTSTAPCSTCSAALTCKGCNINADVLTMSNTSWSYEDPATGTPYLMADLRFTAYSVTTTSSISGKCHTYAKSPIPLIDAYIVSIPTDVFIFLPTTYSIIDPVETPSLSDLAYTAFLDDAYSSFYSHEGLEGCTVSIPPSQFLPTYLGDEAAVSATVASSITPAGSSSLAASTATLTTSSASGHHARRTRTIILSVIIPTVGVMTLLLSFVIIRRYRKKRSPAAMAVDPKVTSDTQLYLDRKAELEDEERRRHELDGGGKVHEMDGQDTLFEMPGDDKSRMNLASPNKMQELRGLDPSQELEVPSNV
ncbi:hypothetical protein BDR22DRAFT_373648 [Usnea florida]